MRELHQICVRAKFARRNKHERSLLWNDPAIGIDWPFSGQPVLAAKDAAAVTLDKAETFE